MRPRKLFQDEDTLKSITSDTSDSEVFNRQEIPTTAATTTKLRRQNAFRRKRINKKVSESIQKPPNGPTTSTEPEEEKRITRSSLRSVSLPTTPSQVILDRPQLLEEVLPQGIPLVPEAVHLGPQVQQLDMALQQLNQNTGRPRRSTRKDINYEKYNETGKKS